MSLGNRKQPYTRYHNQDIKDFHFPKKLPCVSLYRPPPLAPQPKAATDLLSVTI